MRTLNRCRIISLGVAGLAAAAVSLLACVVIPMQAEAQLLQPSEGRTPSFEVATIRPSGSDSDLFNIHIADSRFSVQGAPLKALLKFAYDVKIEAQLPTEPAWIAQEKFDIDARIDDAEVQSMSKLTPDRKFAELRLMLQSLLAERFKLKVSSRMKELPVYALILAKNGPHLTPVNLSPDPKSQRMPQLSGGSRGELKASAVSMPMFCRWLSGRPDTGGRAVLDATGIDGELRLFAELYPGRCAHCAIQRSGSGPGSGKLFLVGFYGAFALYSAPGATWLEAGIPKSAGRSSGHRSRRATFSQLEPVINFPAGGVADENRASTGVPADRSRSCGVGDKAEDEDFGYSKARTTTQYGPIFAATRGPQDAICASWGGKPKGWG